MMVQNVQVGTQTVAKYAAAKMPTERTDCSNKADVYKLFWIFLIGSAVGFAVETIWCLIIHGRLECRSSMIIGPFAVIYGIGALVLYMGKRMVAKNNLLHMFLFGAAASTVVEYVGSLAQETLFGSVSWDYSSQPFNIAGRVSLLYSVFWGLLAILWFVVIQPAFERLISKIPAWLYKPLTWGLAIFLVVDVVISIAAITRWGMRLDGIPPTNVIAEMLDRAFPNAFMMVIYPNMIW